MEKNPSPNLTELRDEVARLHSLLQDPQPGLLSWLQLTALRMKTLKRILNLYDLGGPES